MTCLQNIVVFISFSLGLVRSEFNFSADCVAISTCILLAISSWIVNLEFSHVYIEEIARHGCDVHCECGYLQITTLP